ncbi:deoxyguanosinetriphosphate triphosphohydrolase-like protein [Prevotella sp. MGM2]|jgi:dGTPase|nr:deoxyguanosinetriphosphate triphosphohydrolase-like protein [Prevotella sp. MGM2]
MTMNWKQLISSKRLGKEDTHRAATERRTEFQRDFDRLIFSAPFRRMQNKTQVFPLPGSVFVHNRLTHSLEVSSVGRSLGTDVSRELLARHPELSESDVQPLGAIVSAACLAHDLGNPPFGHSGERAIRSYFSEGAGARLKEYVSADGERLNDVQWADITRFDGNANTFRLLTHQFEGRRRGGYVMTYSTLAAIVKYPFSSTAAPAGKCKFGFFESETGIYMRIAEELGMPLRQEADGSLRGVRHPLVFLVEAADDICYEIMDIEDAYKLRLLSADETIGLLLGFYSEEARGRLMEAYPDATDPGDKIAYYRSCVINALEQACVEVFMTHEAEILAGTFEGSLIDRLPPLLLTAYRRCEAVARHRIYSCKEVTDIDLAGYRIIYTLLELMVEAVLAPEKAYSRLLLGQVSAQYQLRSPRLADRLMAVLDYVSGMTDVYALDLYRKINGHSLPSV